MGFLWTPSRPQVCVFRPPIVELSPEKGRSVSCRARNPRDPPCGGPPKICGPGVLSSNTRGQTCFGAVLFRRNTICGIPPIKAGQHPCFLKRESFPRPRLQIPRTRCFGPPRFFFGRNRRLLQNPKAAFGLNQRERMVKPFG